MASNANDGGTPKKAAIRITLNIARILVLVISSLIALAILVLRISSANPAVSGNRTTGHKRSSHRAASPSSRGVQTDRLRQLPKRQPVYLPSDPNIAR